MTSREQFEAWYDTLSQAWPDSIAKCCKETMWRPWEASRAALVIELPADVTREYYNDESMANGFNDGIDSCRDAIEAAGLKVAP